MSNRGLSIAGRQIGPGAPPWVIAELSANHNGSLERALEIVDAAATAGAHAVKFQTYTADTMTLDIDRDEFVIDDPNSLWHGYTLHRLYDEAHTPWDWHGPLFERCAKHGMAAFSSPFDDTAVEFLESLNAPAYKIASFEVVDLPLIRRCAATGKPLIISTGMSTESEIGEAVDAARQAGCRELVLLKCTSTYPANPSDSNLRTIPEFARRFACTVGVSDHTPGIGAAIAAVSQGACVIEKHLTLRRSDGGVDAAFSLEPAEFSNLVVESERAWQSLGRVQFGPRDREKGSLQFRRSLYVVEDISKGQRLESRHVRAIRPGMGLPPKFLDIVLGKEVLRDLKRGTALKEDHLEGGLTESGNS